MRRPILVSVVFVTLLVFGTHQAAGSGNEAPPGGGRVEHSTWGGLKALCRSAALVPDHADRSDSRESVTRYTLRDSPDHALAKLVEAYVAMDVDAYMDCLSDTLLFWLNPEDVSGDPGLPEYWGAASEHGIHANMFDGGWVESIELTLTPFGEPVEIPGPMPGSPSSWRFCVNYSLWLHLPDELSFWAREGAEFKLSVDPDDVGPGGEELWEVSRWFDVDEHSGSAVAELSWGRIKALYQ